MQSCASSRLLLLLQLQLLLLLLLAELPGRCSGFPFNTIMSMQQQQQLPSSRRTFLAIVGGASAGLALAQNPTEVQALVKGNAPPAEYGTSKMKSMKGPGAGKKKENNIEEAMEKRNVEEAAQRKEQEEEGDAFKTTRTGVRYKDVLVGSGPEIKSGDPIDIRFRVLKLGKRSYDGVSGEAGLVFSYGYGEDDDKVGSSIRVAPGQGQLVQAVDEAMLVGMRVGGIRRVLVRPEQGWKKPDGCAGTIELGVVNPVPGAPLSKVRRMMCPPSLSSF
jgi:FKBP-type peptidyl-prolyl cis-trans isomerase